MTSLRPTARVARGATYLFIQGFLTAIVGVVYFVILAHALSDHPEDMGVFALLSFILALVQILGTFALPSAAVKYISQHLAENDPQKAKAVVARILQVGFLASVVVFALLFLPADLTSSIMFGTNTYSHLLRLIAVCAFFTILQVEVSSFLQGMQKMHEVAILSFTYTGIHTSIGVYLLLIGWRLYGVVLSWLLGLSITSVAGLVLTARSLGVVGKRYPVKPLLNFSLPLYVSNTIAYFVTWVDQLILVSFTNLQVLGVYYVAVRASVVPTLFSGAIIAALFPQLSELYTKQGLNSLKDAFRVSGRYAVLIGFPLVVGVAALAYPTIILLAGVQYADAALPLIIISLAALVGTLGIAINPILMTLERTKIVSVLTLVSLGISVFLSFFVLAFLGLGMVGAAWARALASITGLLLSLYALKRILPLTFDEDALLEASAASLCIIAAILVLDAFRQVFTPFPHQFFVFRLHLLPVYVIFGALAYFASIVGLKAVKKRVVELISEYLPKRMKWLADWLSRIAAGE